MANGLPPGCTQRDVDEAFDGTLPTREERVEALWDALVDIALSPYEVLFFASEGSEPEIERRRRLS